MKARGARLYPKRDQVAATIDGEAVLINFVNGMYYTTGGIGGLVWSFIEQGHRLDDVAAFVAHRYAIPPKKAQEDVSAFAQSLFDEDLVGYCDTGPKAIATEAVPSNTAYAPPQLSKFDDMAEQLALYPPLPGGAYEGRTRAGM